jgi:hypothetical protein
MQVLGILWPTLALVALVFVVWFTLFFQRTAHMKRNPPTAETFADGDSSLRYFRPVEMPANNLANLFELPVLYFALVPLLLLTAQANHIQVLLAWAYVAARALHSFIHIAVKNVPARFLAYAVSVAVLMAMWIGFAVDLVAAASAFNAAHAGLGVV